MHKFAPVLVLTLCRYDHFRACVESLSACLHAKQTILYIALDYPLTESHWEGYRKILNFIPEICGFKKIILIKRDFNHGVLLNFTRATNYIFETHDRYIMSEDDNIFSVNFLDYINKGLCKFEHHEHIFAINGYAYPIEVPKEYTKNVYLWKALSGWGYGIWRDRWKKIDTNFDNGRCFEIVEEFLSHNSNIAELERYGEHYLPSLLKMVNKRVVRGDSYIDMHIIKFGQYCVFPVVSKVRNCGHDGSGVHGGIEHLGVYRNQKIDGDLDFNFDENIEAKNPHIYSILKRHFKRTIKGNLKLIMMSAAFFYKKISKSRI